jgi:hypothetical protein
VRDIRFLIIDIQADYVVANATPICKFFFVKTLMKSDKQERVKIKLKDAKIWRRQFCSNERIPNYILIKFNFTMIS